MILLDPEMTNAPVLRHVRACAKFKQPPLTSIAKVDGLSHSPAGCLLMPVRLVLGAFGRKGSIVRAELLQWILRSGPVRPGATNALPPLPGPPIEAVV